MTTERQAMSIDAAAGWEVEHRLHRDATTHATSVTGRGHRQSFKTKGPDRAVRRPTINLYKFWLDRSVASAAPATPAACVAWGLKSRPPKDARSAAVSKLTCLSLRR